MSTLQLEDGPERLTTGPGPDTDIAISPDGKRLAYTARTENIRLWSLPFDAIGLTVSRDGRVCVIYPKESNESTGALGGFGQRGP